MKNHLLLPIVAAVSIPLATFPLQAGLFTLSSVDINAIGTTGFDSRTSFAGGTSSSLSRSGASYFFGPGVTNVLGTSTVSAMARADAGTLGVQTQVGIHSTGSTALLSSKAGAYENPGAGQFFDAQGAQAKFGSSDLSITPIPGAGVVGAGFVRATLNLALDGSFVSNPAVGGPGTASSSTTLSLSVRFGYEDPVTHFQGASLLSGTMTLTQSLGNPAVFGAGAGLLAGYHGGPLPLALAVDGLPIGVPISLDVSMGTITELTAAGNVDFAGGVDFYHTLTLPTTGDVLTLPAGYTADSAELNVSGNSFVAVPEPATWSVVAAVGLAGFAVLRRRRSRG